MNIFKNNLLVSKTFILLIFTIGLFSKLAANPIDTLSIKNHLNKIIDTKKPRNHENIESLNYVANYIYTVFDNYDDSTYYQKYKVNTNEYKNVVCVFGSLNKETIIIGAYYDVCGSQDGADDNASGVVGLLEIAKLLKGKKLKYRIELVAYTLEEPPYFRSKNMGSFVHAKSLYDNKTPVYGMISLEMIGYFDDAKKSQKYPISALSAIYGNKGNYITLVNKFSKGKFARMFSRKFKNEKLIKTKKFIGPAKLQGIDFSDHLNYWNFNYSALMITDTAFYRNKNYHKETDTIETLNIQKMSSVVTSTYKALINL